MEAVTTVSIPVQGLDQAGEARRAAAALAKGAGFSEPDTGRASIVAMEAATNIARHGGGGEILLQVVPGNSPAFEMMALDKGPGMAHPARCLEDGYSTAGSTGTGLGAIRRLSSRFDIYSEAGKGTALLSRIVPDSGRARVWPPPSRLEYGAVSVPARGETVCGDAWAVFEDRTYASVVVVDGLGHGLAAAESAGAALTAFAADPKRQPADLLGYAHAGMRATRGGALAVARLEFLNGSVRFVGIGNIAGVISGAQESRQMVSLPGIAGHNSRNVREFTYPWGPRDLVLLYSDGISTHWSIQSYSGLQQRDLSLIAAVLYRDWNRGRDDATVVVLRMRASG